MRKRLALWELGGFLFTAALGTALHFISFGADPMRDKGMEGVDAFQTERVANAVAEAEKHLTALRESARPVADRALMDQIDRFSATARTMFRTLENDPRDLRAEKQGTRNRARQSRSRCARRNLATNHAHGSSRGKDKPEDQQSGETALARQTPWLPELVVVEHGRQVNRQQRNKEQNRRKRFGQRFKRGRTC